MNIADLLQQHGVQTASSSHHHVRHGWIGVDCPRCSPGSLRYRLGFDTTSGRANCWVCGRVADPVAVLADLCGLPYRAVVAVMGRSVQPRTQAPPHSGTFKPPLGCGALLPAHRQYLMRRGLDPDAIERIWEIQGIGIAGNLAWRIFIPIFDADGEPVSWTTRALVDDGGLRYVSAQSEQEAIPHKNIIYGAHLAQHAIVVVEGPLDAWAGGPGFCATCGVGLTEKQILAVSRYPVRAICLDAEPDAQRRAREICRKLAPFPGSTENIVLESGKDAVRADPQEIDEIRRTYLSI